MSLTLHVDDPNSLKPGRFLEMSLVAAILTVTFVMWNFSTTHPVMLHLYYIPVVVTGFYLGRYRARLMALLCILTVATILFLPRILDNSVHIIPTSTLLGFLFWGTTLVVIAMLVGKLSDGLHAALVNLHEALRKDVLSDALTEVANRRAYEFELKRRYAQWKRDRTSFSLIMLDIDYFKNFNDRFGHPAGDAVLKAVAEVLQATVRKADLLARCGGEEFGIVLPGISLQELKDVAERMRSMIEGTRFTYNDLRMRLTVSVGCAQILPGEDVTSFTQRADAALYGSKDAGRNCVHFHNGVECEKFGEGIAMDVKYISEQGGPSLSDSFPYTDETTGLPTQKVFLEELRRRVSERMRYGHELAVAIAQLDEYSAVPDSQVRAAKTMLTSLARISTSLLRDTDLITRYNTDSVAILLPATSLQSAVVPLRRLCQQAAIYSDGQYPGLSFDVSIGVAEVLNNELAGGTLQRVEFALTEAAASGGGVIFVHDGNQCRVLDDNPVINL